MAVTSGHCSRTVLCTLSHRQKHKLVAWETSVHWGKHFVYRIARIWTRLIAIWGALQHTVYHSTSTIIKVSPQLTKWRERLSKAWQKLPHGAIIAIRQMAPLFSKVDSNKLWRDVQNEETVICAKFVKDLFNIPKVIGRKTKWPRFFGIPGIWGAKNSGWHNAWLSGWWNLTPAMRCHAVNTGIM